MLQIDHVYEFFYEHLYRDFGIGYLKGGVTDPNNQTLNIEIFNRNPKPTYKIFFFDQEPILPIIHQYYFDFFDDVDIELEPRCKPILITSEHSREVRHMQEVKNYHHLYYFFHGFAALDWYRGYQCLNFSKPVIKTYTKDFISYNRIVTHDRSYRIYFVSLLQEKKLLPHGVVSFAVDGISYIQELTNKNTKLSKFAQQHIDINLQNVNTPIVIDQDTVMGSKSADILRTVDLIDLQYQKVNVDAFWHIVTETVFYYDKLHLTEKIFKPIVSKQPFMLLAAPGNLAYLKSYGFKTFDSVIDESYDQELDNDLRVQKVVEQLNWYCNLSPQEKTRVQRELEPVIEHNFNHFYGEFRHIITTELLDNCRRLFNEIGYDDSAIAYKELYRVLTS